MVILRKPQQRMRGVAGQELRDDAEAVDIGGDCGGHDERFFTARKRGGAARRGDRGEQPSGKEVGYGTHYYCRLNARKDMLHLNGAAASMSSV